jgi:hypothetical protein
MIVSSIFRHQSRGSFASATLGYHHGSKFRGIASLTPAASCTSSTINCTTGRKFQDQRHIPQRRHENRRELNVASRPTDLIGHTPLLDLTKILKANGIDNGSVL